MSLAVSPVIILMVHVTILNREAIAAPPSPIITKHNELTAAPRDVCADHHCRPGRVCRPLSSQPGGIICECAPNNYCAQHSNNQPVCGSDRSWYPSHCELHRTACTTGFHLHVVENRTHCDVIQEQERVKLVFTEGGTDVASDVMTSSYQIEQSTSSVPVNSSDSPTICSDREYLTLMRKLIEFHCVDIGYNNCLNSSQEYQLASVILFHYFDKNSDEKLSFEELTQVEYGQQLKCLVTDLVPLFDHDNDSSLSMVEFKKASSIPIVTLDEDLTEFHTTVIAGSGLQLKCNIRDSEKVVWTRNGKVLNSQLNSQFKTYDDGSLYIHEVALHHAGNYTCTDPQWNDVIQTHKVKVETVPLVRVNPSTQVHSPRSSATLQCYAIGTPAPSVEWQLNELPLQSINPWRYLLLDNNRTLVIHSLSYPSDTGAYKCRAQNEAGSSQDIATVFVEQSELPHQRFNYNDGSEYDPYQAFVVFHDNGYTIYEPTRCHGYRHVTAEFSVLTHSQRNDRMASNLPTWRHLCSSATGETAKCVWGNAVNIRNKFLYVSQPELNRVVVIDIRDHHSPVELISTDERPVEIHYVEPLDQLLVVCWGQHDGARRTEGTRTVIVIRDASDEKRHNVVHVWPADGLQIHGSIGDLFLLQTDDMTQFGAVSQGYATVIGQQKLVVLDLKSSKYTKEIDLSDFNCQPIRASAIAVGGRYIMQCTSSTGINSCISIDYVTDHVMPCPAQLSGATYVSPDVKYLAVVHNSKTLMSLFSLDEYGWPPRSLYDVNVGVELSDVMFVTPTSDESSSSYNVLATAANQDAVIYVEVDTGRLSIVEGADWYVSAAITPWTDSYAHERRLTPSGVFGNLLMTRGISGDSVTVLDSRERRVQCDWQNVSHPVTSVWIEPLRL